MMCRPGAGRMAFQAVWLAPSRPLPVLAPTNETQIESRLACQPAPLPVFRGDFPDLGLHGATCRPPTRVLPDPNHLQPLLGGGPSLRRRCLYVLSGDRHESQARSATFVSRRGTSRTRYPSARRILEFRRRCSDLWLYGRRDGALGRSCACAILY